MIATENTENTEDFFSVSSVLSVTDNINIDLYRLPLNLKWILILPLFVSICVYLWFLFVKLSLYYSIDKPQTESTNNTLLHSMNSSKSLLFLKLIGISIIYSRNES